MLKLRICPKCGTESRSDVSYFCHSCGTRLPEMGHKSKALVSDQKQKAPRGISKPNINRLIKLSFYVLFSSAFLISLGYLIVFYVNKKINSQGTVSKPLRNQVIRKDFNLDIEEFSFGADDIFSVVPEDVDFYLESRNADLLLGYILNQAEKQRLEDILSFNLLEATSFLEETFVLLERKDSVSFIAKVKAYDFVKNKIGSLEDIEPWQVNLVGNYLTVSNSQDFQSDIQKAFKKQILSLALSSEFLNVKKHLPEKGQIFVYIPARLKEGSHLSIERERLKLIPDTLSGIGFVAEKDEQNTKITGIENE